MSVEKIDINVEELPSDVNAKAIALINEKVFDNNLLEMFELARRKRLWGDVTHYSPNGKVRALFTFRSGVCMKCALYEWVGTRNLFRKSIPFYKQG